MARGPNETYLWAPLGPWAAGCNLWSKYFKASSIGVGAGFGVSSGAGPAATWVPEWSGQMEMSFDAFMPTWAARGMFSSFSTQLGLRPPRLKFQGVDFASLGHQVPLGQADSSIQRLVLLPCPVPGLRGKDDANAREPHHLESIPGIQRHGRFPAPIEQGLIIATI